MWRDTLRGCLSGTEKVKEGKRLRARVEVTSDETIIVVEFNEPGDDRLLWIEKINAVLPKDNDSVEIVNNIIRNMKTIAELVNNELNSAENETIEKYRQINAEQVKVSYDKIIREIAKKVNGKVRIYFDDNDDELEYIVIETEFAGAKLEIETNSILVFNSYEEKLTFMGIK